MPLIPFLTNSSAASSLYSAAGSGGGGGGGGSNFDAASISSLTVSTINGVVPGGGGGDIPTAGISTNQIATASGTVLTMTTGGGTYITMDSNKGVMQLFPGGEVGSIQMYGGAIQTATNCDMTISSINGQTPGGGITPFQSTIGFDGISFPLTCPAGTPTPIVNNYPLTGGHTYTAAFNCSYAMNTSDQNNAIAVNFDAPADGTSYGPLWSPPAFLNNATSSDGAPGAFSLTWTQYATSVKGGVYVTPSGTGYETIINSIVAGSDPRLVITDWGVL